MASVGSVELNLELNRSAFNRDLTLLQSLKLEPLKLGVELDGQVLRVKIKDLAKDLGSIPINITTSINVKEIQSDISKTLESLAKELQVKVRAAVEGTVRVDSRGQTEQGNDKIQARLEQGMERVAQRLNEKIEAAIDSSIKNTLNIATAPFRQVFTGVFEGVGQNIGGVLSRGLISTFQREAGVNLKNLGSQAGTAFAGVLNDLRGQEKTKETTKSSRIKEQSSQSDRANKQSNQSGAIASELKKLLSEFNTVSAALKDASKGVGKFGKGAFTAADDALRLATALTKLYGALQTSPINNAATQNKGGGSKNPLGASNTDQRREESGARRIERPMSSNPWLAPNPTIKGFLRGDKSTLTKEDASRQVEATRMRLQKRLETLQSIPGGASSKQIGVLLNAIATIESRIATDIADPSLPQEVKRSLGQLRAVNSKLATTRRALVAESARVSAVNPQGVKARGGIGVAGKVLGAGLGATILSAGQSFAATGAASSGTLGFLGALPFDPTLGLGAGGVAGSLALARFAPRLIRKAGGTKLADILERNISEKIGNIFTDTIASAKQATNGLFKRSVRGINYKSSSITTSVLNKKVDEIESQIGNIIDSVQQDIIKNQGIYFSKNFVANQLKSGQYYDPRFAAAKKQQDFLQKQYNRNDEELTQNQPTTSVNQLTGRRKLIATDDPIFKQLRGQQVKIDNAARQAQQEIFKESGQIYRLRTVKDLLRSGKRNDGDYLGLAREKEKIVADLRRKERSTIAPMPASSSPDKFWDNFFRAAEARFFRSQLFKNVAPKDRRSLTSEATGFFTAGAALAAPGATLTALSVPLLAALTPLITTVGLVTNAIAPLVGTVSQTLKQIQPLEARLQYVSGSPQGVAENRSFVQGVAEKFNISNFSSLEQFSKLSAAVKGTRLEGEPLKELFKGIATAAKGLSLDTQDLSLVMYAFTQIASKGKLSAEEVRLQLAERFPGIIGILAKSLSVTTAEFNKMLESGSLIAEDVLPKLGKALQQEYGAAAAAASGNFLSSLTKVENAIFKIKESVARGLAPLFGFVANTLGDAIGLIGQFADKLVPIFSVVLVGFAAQFFVGLTQVSKGVLAQMTPFFAALFSRLFVTLTPFAIGILADFLDDVVGAQTSVMDNLMRGVYNSIVTVILAVQSAQKGVANFFGNLPKLPQNNSFSFLGDSITFVGNALKPVIGLIRGTGVELVSLTLIMAQTLVLAQAGVNVVLARFGLTIASLGTSFVAAGGAVGLFKTSLKTLMAGLTPVQFAATAAAAALVLFFSKADLKDDLGESFDKLESAIASNLDRIREALKETGKDADELKKKLDFKSKGFDLTVGLGESLGGETYRSDDLIKLLRSFKGQSSPLNNAAISTLLQSFGGIPGLFGSAGFNAVNPSTKTLAETFFQNNLNRTKKDTSEAIRVVDESGLLNGKFSSSIAGKNLAEIEKIDQKIKSLQTTKIDLLGSPSANSDAVKKQVADLDKQINDAIKERSPLAKPIESIRDNILKQGEDLKASLESFNSSDFPEAAKKQLRNELQPAIDKTEEAKRALNELRLIDLSPLGNSFTDVTKQIEKTDKALERALSKGQLEALKTQASIQSRLAAGKISPEQAQTELFEKELKSLKVRSAEFEKFLKSRKAELKDLLAIPSPNPDQLSAIDKNRKEIEAKEIELEQNRLSISQKLVEGKKQAEERILRDFQRVNAKAAEAISKAETARLTQIKQRQLAGIITPEQATLETSTLSNSTAAKNLDEAKRQITEFNKLKKTGKISDEEVRNREIELSRALADSNLRVVESQLSQQQELRNAQIRAIEERTQKHKNSSDLIIAGIDSQKAAQDLLNASIDRTKELEQSRFDLSKALSDAAISASETRLNSANQALDLSKRLSEGDLDPKVRSAINNQLSVAGFGNTELQILTQRQQIEADIAAKRLDALKIEQEFQKKSLELDLQRQRIVAQTAQYEAEIGVLRSQQSILDAQAALDRANVLRDKLAIDSAKIGLDIANQQLNLSNKQLKNSQENLKIQDELSRNAVYAQKVSSDALVSNAIAQENARVSGQRLERDEASNRINTSQRTDNQTDSVKNQINDVADPTSAPLDKKQKKLSFLEQAWQSMGAMLGSVNRRYLPPDQSGSIGLNRATSVESQLLASLGLDPFETTENYLKRPRTSFFGGGGSYDELNLKYKPSASSLNELQQKYPSSLDDLVEKGKIQISQQTSGSSSFATGLKEANRSIEQKLDILNQTMTQVAAAPRQLYVTSNSPVSDASQIYTEIARGMVTASGLG